MTNHIPKPRRDPLCGVFEKVPHKSGYSIPVVSAKDKTKIIGKVPVSGPSGFRWNRREFGRFLAALVELANAELGLRAAHRKGRLTKLLVSKRDRAASLFEHEFGPLARMLWQPVGRVPYFNPLYFPRHDAGRIAFEAVVDVVHALYGIQKGGSSGRPSSLNAEEQETELRYRRKGEGPLETAQAIGLDERKLSDSEWKKGRAALLKAVQRRRRASR